jgi:hypothetical protein
MSPSPQDVPVHVAAEERAHPAYRKLARACITLARLQLGERSHDTAVSSPAAKDREADK